MLCRISTSQSPMLGAATAGLLRPLCLLHLQRGSHSIKRMREPDGEPFRTPATTSNAPERFISKPNRKQKDPKEKPVPRP